MQSVSRSFIDPLGGNGNHRRRLLFHHLPLAITSAVILVLFTAAPVFDVRAYGHPDITSRGLPQAQAEAGPTGAPGHGSERHDVAVRVRSAPGANHTATMGHGGQGRHAVHSAEPGSMAHGNGSTRAGDQGANGAAADRRVDVGLSRTVQQLTVATGYVGVALLAVTLLLGPANLLLRRRNPVSTYLRRDVGIWTAIFSVVHVIPAILIHVSHGSGLATTVLHFFVAEDGRPLTNSFGLGNWTGLTALVIVVGLLATSSDAALRKLKARPWKWVQRLTYVLFALVVLHAFFYGALLRITSPFTVLLIVSVIVVCVGQTIGMYLWRRPHG